MNESNMIKLVFYKREILRDTSGKFLIRRYYYRCFYRDLEISPYEEYYRDVPYFPFNDFGDQVFECLPLLICIVLLAFMLGGLVVFLNLPISDYGL